jgi:hypothetical protein
MTLSATALLRGWRSNSRIFGMYVTGKLDRVCTPLTGFDRPKLIGQRQIYRRSGESLGMPRTFVGSRFLKFNEPI